MRIRWVCNMVVIFGCHCQTWILRTTRVVIACSVVIFFSVNGAAKAEETGNVLPSLKGACKVYLSAVVPWDCVVVAKPGDPSGFRPRCSRASYFVRDPIFFEIKKAKSARAAIANLISNKLKHLGFRETIDWLVCQKIFVLVSATSSPLIPNPKKIITKMQIGISFYTNPDLASEAKKWDDLLIKENIIFFPFYSTPSVVAATINFSLDGDVVDIDVSSSDK